MLSVGGLGVPSWFLEGSLARMLGEGSNKRSIAFLCVYYVRHGIGYVNRNSELSRELVRHLVLQKLCDETSIPTRGIEPRAIA